MSRAELLAELEVLGEADLRAEIEAATHLVARHFPVEPGACDSTDDPILRVAGCFPGKPISTPGIDEELYGDLGHS